MKYEIKKKTAGITEDAKRVFNNTERLAQIASLFIIVAFSAYALRTMQLNKYIELAVLASLVVVGLRAAVEYLRYMSDKDK